MIVPAFRSVELYSYNSVICIVSVQLIMLLTRKRFRRRPRGARAHSALSNCAGAACCRTPRARTGGDV